VSEPEAETPEQAHRRLLWRQVIVHCTLLRRLYPGDPDLVATKLADYADRHSVRYVKNDPWWKPVPVRRDDALLTRVEHDDGA
jgi:hypothetical protein